MQRMSGRNHTGEAFGVRGRVSGKHRFGTPAAPVTPTTTERAASLNPCGARRKPVSTLMGRSSRGNEALIGFRIPASTLRI